jgi:hypothetical protein
VTTMPDDIPIDGGGIGPVMVKIVKHGAARCSEKPASKSADPNIGVLFCEIGPDGYLYVCGE